MELPINRFFETPMILGNSTHPFFKRWSIVKSQSIYSSKDNVFSRAYQSDPSIYIVLSTFTLLHLKKTFVLWVADASYLKNTTCLANPMRRKLKTHCLFVIRLIGFHWYCNISGEIFIHIRTIKQLVLDAYRTTKSTIYKLIEGDSELSLNTSF